MHALGADPEYAGDRLLPLMQRFAEMLVSSGLFGKFLSTE